MIRWKISEMLRQAWGDRETGWLFMSTSSCPVVITGCQKLQPAFLNQKGVLLNMQFKGHTRIMYDIGIFTYTYIYI